MPEDVSAVPHDDQLDDEAEASEEDPLAADSADVFDGVSTTLVEVLPGTAIVFGEVPEGLELVEFGFVSATDRDRLSVALSAIGNAATIVGNVGNALAAAQGLYRVTDATLALLNNGAQLAAKDGANLGAMFANGKIVGQARFIPYGVTVAQAAAAIGPALAMIAIQMQLNEVSGLVRANIALTTQTLESIRREQWAELAGLTMSIDRAIGEATEVRAVTRLIWEDVAGIGKHLDKQVDLYKQNVKTHVRKLGSSQGPARRQYLEANAEAILFDANSLLYSLKAHSGYQALRAARAQAEGVDNLEEAQLADVIARNAREEFESSLQSSGDLLVALTRELRIIAELPGRRTIPLTKKRQDGKAARFTCAQLLEAIEPLADSIRPRNPELIAPDALCAPEGIELKPYLTVMRWFMADGEKLRGLAFPYQHGAHDVADALPIMLASRVDAAWARLGDGRLPALADRAVPSTVVAITDRRVITAGTRGLLRRGELGRGFSLDDVRYVRTSTNRDGTNRASIEVATRDSDVRWMFATDADLESIGQIAGFLSERMSIPDAERYLNGSTRQPLVEGSVDRVDDGEQ